MSAADSLKGSCQQCGQHIQFPSELAGSTIDCPACGQGTELFPFEADPGTSATLGDAELLKAFQQPIPRSRVSVVYQIGLVFVAIAMVILPLLYLGLIALAGWATYHWATDFTSVMGGRGRVAVFRFGAYVAPLFAGVALVFFMVKPLFARRPQHAQPLALNPGAEPLLFAFVSRICETVGAPYPTRIDVDCNLNAAASFRRGFGSFFRNDLVLTLGLPLVAGLQMNQLAGILAHEFGHFTQGFGMRLTYIIRSVNFWFARVVYERDAWDVALQEWAEEGEGGSVFIAWVAQIAVWTSRQLLKLLMFFGHGVGCFMLRQMEYDADSYEIKLAGSEVYEACARRVHVLDHVSERAYKTMRVGWNNNRELPEDFCAYLDRVDSQIESTHRAKLEDRMGLRKTGVFDTHPSDGDRIRRARLANEPGVFHLDRPARELLCCFAVLAKQVTHLHYSDDLGIPVELAKLMPLVRAMPAAPEQSPLAPDEAQVASLPGSRLKFRKS